MHYYFGYDGSGNMTQNSRVSADYLGYDASQPHAVSSVRATEGTISPSRCEVGYNSRNRPAYITEEEWRIDIDYGGGLQREKSVLTQDGSPVRTTLFISGDCEHEETPTFSRYIDYIKVGGQTVALHVYNETANGDSIYYVQTDLLGSWERVVDADKNMVQSSHFDPWGNRMSPTDWTASQDGSGFRFHRGFTGHEHYDEFGVINMNARLYDPALGRFFSPDPQVQSPFSTQGFNRYSYCGNNPVMYSDPDGEIAWMIPVIISTTIGIYSGGVIANNGEYNPFRWDYNSGTTWKYMLGGCITGFFSGWAGAAIAASQIPMASTISLFASSFISSVGANIYTDERVPVSLNFGFFSHNFTDNSWNWMFKSGNGCFENVGYIFGVMANLSDILIGFNPQKVDLITEHTGKGHSALVEPGSTTGTEMNDPNGIISIGPDLFTDQKRNLHWMKGTNHWSTHTGDGNPIWRHSLNVNKNIILDYANKLNYRESAGILHYSVEFSSCVTHTSIALNKSGIFNIGIHPYLLSTQMYLWSNGLRPWSFSYFFNLQ